jgi:hypothetical protein
MRVIKESWLLQEVQSGVFKCMQNTSTPKLYVSETSAKREVKIQNGDNGPKYKLVKAFLVIEETPAQDELPF